MVTHLLNGAWNLVYHDGERGSKLEFTRYQTGGRPSFIAQVPGDVHLDLIRNGLLCEPAEGLNSLAARWVEDVIWTMQKEFDWQPSAEFVWLEFDRIAGCAEITLNGHVLGRHANDFLPIRFEVSRYLRPGKNLLCVAVESGAHTYSDVASTPYAHGSASVVTKRMWRRKPQCQFGWDWAPRLINVGLSGEVRLISSPIPIVVKQVVPDISLSEDLERGHVKIRLFIENSDSVPQQVEVEAALFQLGCSAIATVGVGPGEHCVELGFDVPNPPLWWPRGHGAQHLEPLRVTVRTQQGLVNTTTQLIGFRRVKVDQSVLSEGGSAFVLEVNNRPIFCRGANFVPPDLIACRVDQERLNTLMDRAEELNFNFLRVWGGGWYESDAFYAEADRRGFLIWQDMIYACSRYPLHDKTFFDEAVKEARWQVRRLARHPSLVVLCGNNEIETANWDWGWDAAGLQAPDHAFFHITLARLVISEATGIFYWPSSPYSPFDREFGRMPNPNDDRCGDQHPWSLGFVDTDFRKYRNMVCRFPNEGGVLGPPAFKTLLACLPEGHRYRGSFAWMHHENSIAFWTEPSAVDAQIQQWTGQAPESLTLEDYVYWGGLVQGEGLREYCENFRRRMFRSAAAVFWMFNDTWPTVRSWTPVDYYMRRTPSFHFVRRSFQPVTVVLCEEGAAIKVYGINDTPRPFVGVIEYGVLHFRDGEELCHRKEAVLAANALTPLAEIPSGALGDAKHHIAFAILHDPAKEWPIARARFARDFPAVWQLAEPRIEVACDGSSAIFKSPVFVWGVCLDLDGERPLADNFFDLFPGRPHSIPWPFQEEPKILRCGFKGG